MKLSIIVPVYNTRTYLDRCLQSLVNQSISSNGGYEILAINDGSTDGSLLILDKWQKKYPQLVRVLSQKNAGVSSARNLGIENAKGDWIAFCDSDDYIAEYTLGQLLDCVSEDSSKDIGLVRYGLTHVSRKDPISDEVSFNKLYKLDKTIFFKEHLYWGVWHFLYKRELLMNSDVRFRSTSVSEDGLFNVEYLLQRHHFSVIGFDK